MTKIKPRILITGGSGFIGTNLISDLMTQNVDILNLDLAAPKIDAHRQFWHCADIQKQAEVEHHVATFKPHAIVHLAAKVDLDPRPEAFRGPNIDGSRHVLDSATSHQVSRVILTSTQYVNGPLAPFDDDLAFHPATAYGESKAEMENLARRPEYTDLDWIIIRPTYVWGPFHPRFPSEIWRYIKLGLYVHPSGAPIIRSYGYVRNVTRQIIALLTATANSVRHKIFYVGDPPMDSGLFLDALSIELRGAPVRRVPRWLIHVAGRVGDAMRSIGLKVPLFSERVTRMTTDHLARDEAIWKQLECKPIDLKVAVHETAVWLKETYPKYFRD